jgi:prenyltransferase beta subunit
MRKADYICVRMKYIYIYIDQRSGEQVYTYILACRYRQGRLKKKIAGSLDSRGRYDGTFLHVLLYIYFLRLNSVYIVYILGNSHLSNGVPIWSPLLCK